MQKVSIGNRNNWTSLLRLLTPLFQDLKQHFQVEIVVTLALYHHINGNDITNNNSEKSHVVDVKSLHTSVIDDMQMKLSSFMQELICLNMQVNFLTEDFKPKD